MMGDGSSCVRTCRIWRIARHRTRTSGRDVSGEILNEGTPDAAKWLGLDRRVIPLGGVRSSGRGSRSLQTMRRRCRTSCSERRRQRRRDATAAEAIARLEDFQREHVGQDRANSTKPLQRAKVRLAAAETALTSAREKHANWLTVEAQALALRKRADDEERRLRMFHALRALERCRSVAREAGEGARSGGEVPRRSARHLCLMMRHWLVTSRPH